MTDPDDLLREADEQAAMYGEEQDIAPAKTLYGLLAVRIRADGAELAAYYRQVDRMVARIRELETAAIDSQTDTTWRSQVLAAENAAGEAEARAAVLVAAAEAKAAALESQLAVIEEDGTKEHNAAIKLRTEVAALREALEILLETCACQNGCDPDDMTCATNFARAARAATEQEAEGLKPQVRDYDNTPSAAQVMKDHFFPEAKTPCPDCGDTGYNLGDPVSGPCPNGCKGRGEAS